MSRSLIIAALALCAARSVSGHNFVVCTDSYPDLPTLNAAPPADVNDTVIGADRCKGYPRAFPSGGVQKDNFGDQGYPWEGIWPLNDGAAWRNHRVANWLQENPVYDPQRKEAHVKPKSTVLVQVATNNHAHEWKMRWSGRHMIFLAGKSNTQLKTGNQLTWDRLIFSSPTCKYAHINAEPPNEYGGFEHDPGSTFLPLKLVDPAGNWLPEGTYHFIFAYFWNSGSPDYVDVMIPSYTSAFDIVISNDAESTGAVKNCDQADGCHAELVGTNSVCPGAKDTTPPWAPFPNNGAYLFTNPDGDDPSTPNGKRTFQPYWTEFVEASDAPAITYSAPPDIKTWTEDQLEAKLPVGNVNYPESGEGLPFLNSGPTLLGFVGHKNAPNELPVTQKYNPMNVGTVGSSGPSGGSNSTMGTGHGTMTTGSTGSSGTGMYGSAKPSSSATSGSTTGMGSGTDTQGGDTQGGDTQGGDTQGSDTQGSDTQGTGTKPVVQQKDAIGSGTDVKPPNPSHSPTGHKGRFQLKCTEVNGTL